MGTHNRPENICFIHTAPVTITSFQQQSEDMFSGKSDDRLGTSQWIINSCTAGTKCPVQANNVTRSQAD
jgi:hypothetical protein